MKLLMPAVLLTAFCVSLCPGCGGKKAVNAVGSTSIQPFAAELAQAFNKTHPEAKVRVQGGGSTAGLQALTNGIADIGMCSRLLTEDEAKEFTPITIARDGLAIVVNVSNPINNLTMDQVRDLFSGKITNWKDLGGPDKEVTLITREEGSGTREAFIHLVMGDERVPRDALVQQSNGAVRELVRNDPAGVGYMSLGMVSDVKAIPIDGVEPSADAVTAGRYRLARPFLFVTKGAPRPEAQEFIDYALSPEGQQRFKDEGLVGIK